MERRKASPSPAPWPARSLRRQQPWPGRQLRPARRPGQRVGNLDVRALPPWCQPRRRRAPPGRPDGRPSSTRTSRSPVASAVVAQAARRLRSPQAAVRPGPPAPTVAAPAPAPAPTPTYSDDDATMTATITATTTTTTGRPGSRTTMTEGPRQDGRRPPPAGRLRTGRPRRQAPTDEAPAPRRRHHPHPPGPPPPPPSASTWPPWAWPTRPRRRPPTAPSWSPARSRPRPRCPAPVRSSSCDPATCLGRRVQRVLGLVGVLPVARASPGRPPAARRQARATRHRPAPAPAPAPAPRRPSPRAAAAGTLPGVGGRPQPEGRRPADAAGPPEAAPDALGAVAQNSWLGPGGSPPDRRHRGPPRTGPGGYEELLGDLLELRPRTRRGAKLSSGHEHARALTSMDFSPADSHDRRHAGPGSGPPRPPGRRRPTCFSWWFLKRRLQVGGSRTSPWPGAGTGRRRPRGRWARRMPTCSVGGRDRQGQVTMGHAAARGTPASRRRPRFSLRSITAAPWWGYTARSPTSNKGCAPESAVHPARGHGTSVSGTPRMPKPPVPHPSGRCRSVLPSMHP